MTEPLSHLSKAELKIKASEMGLTTFGTKEELIERIQPYSRHRWTEQLALELERPCTLIDHNYIVIWLDHAGWYNHATSYGNKEINIVISRFRQFNLQPSGHDMPGYSYPHNGNPIILLSCKVHEAMDLTRFIVHWSRSNENGTPVQPEFYGIERMTTLPKIWGASRECWQEHLKDVADTECWYRRMMAQGGK